MLPHPQISNIAPQNNPNFHHDRDNQVKFAEKLVKSMLHRYLYNKLMFHTSLLEWGLLKPHPP